MIIPLALAQRFDEHVPLVRDVGRRVKETLLTYCEQKGFAFTSRFKTLDSLAEKIETGRFKKWSEIDDLFACTVIVPTLSHEQAVIEFCRTAFTVRDVKQRGQSRKAPDVFRFDSPRVLARLRRPEHVAGFSSGTSRPGLQPMIRPTLTLHRVM